MRRSRSARLLGHNYPDAHAFSDSIEPSVRSREPGRRAPGVRSRRPPSARSRRPRTSSSRPAADGRSCRRNPTRRPAGPAATAGSACSRSPCPGGRSRRGRRPTRPPRARRGATHHRVEREAGREAPDGCAEGIRRPAITNDGTPISRERMISTSARVETRGAQELQLLESDGASISRPSTGSHLHHHVLDIRDDQVARDEPDQPPDDVPERAERRGRMGPWKPCRRRLSSASIARR